MKKNVIVFGLISGLIISAFMAISMAVYGCSGDLENGQIIGYSAMIVALAFIFVGIKNFRDKHNDGVVSFATAFKVGLFIALIASTMYVITWMIEYYCFMPDFMEKYSAHAISTVKASGATEAEIAKKVAEMESYKEWYKNPLLVVLLTYMEILPVGLVFSVIGALIFKRKSKDASLSATV